MARVQLAKNLASALKGADQLLVVLSESLLRAGKLKALPDGLGKVAEALGQQLEAGPVGGSAWTLTQQSKPAVLGLVLLPDEAARHNHPARPEVVTRLAAQHPGSPKKLAIAVFCRQNEHQLALLNGVSRAFPQLDLRSGAEVPSVALCTLDRGGRPLAIDPFAQRCFEASRLAAELVDTPPSELHPGEFSGRAKARLKKLKGVKLSEIVGDKLSAQGLGGIYGVGKAASQPPRLLIATHSPAKASRHVALVGKGITFDTGGLHLKGRGSMEGMKCDMGGAAAMLGAFEILAGSSVPTKVSLLLAMAENAIGPGAFKPDDVLTLHSGKTVEINNTDAEGRLLLGDGVSWAARKLGADTVLDAATLTGAQMVATGALHGAVVCNDAELEDRFVAAARLSGDLTHPLPFAPELYQPEFQSAVADMKNSVKNRMNAQASCAAQFVYAHLEGTDVKWGHIDLAGPAWRNERGTGYGASLIATLVRDLSAPKRRRRR
ncbi:MAG: leucyl aminopeptidase family protein [Myxococcota bacterium]